MCTSTAIAGWRGEASRLGLASLVPINELVYAAGCDGGFFSLPLCVSANHRLIGRPTRMLFKTISAAVYGIDAHCVEVDVGSGGSRTLTWWGCRTMR